MEKGSTNFSIQSIPALDLTHLKRLTDETGMLQHATYTIPNRKEGYCIDDNSRALLAVLMASRFFGEEQYSETLIPTYISFLQFMQLEDGFFRNFLSYGRQYLDERGSDDAFGRTIWTLGFLVASAPSEPFKVLGKQMFVKAYPHFKELTSPRAIAATIIGLYYFYKNAGVFHLPGNHGEKGSDRQELLELMQFLAKRLTDAYYGNSDAHWKWYEDVISYDNALLPLSLFFLNKLQKEVKNQFAAVESTEYLSSLMFLRNHLTPIGNASWLVRGGTPSQWDQQPLEAMGMVLLFYHAYLETGDQKYINRMITSYSWFHGENDLNTPVFDPITHGCCDGLSSKEVNFNQGAESTLAYWLSHLTMRLYLENSPLF